MKEGETIAISLDRTLLRRAERLRARGFEVIALAAEPDGATRLFAEKGRASRAGGGLVLAALIFSAGAIIYGRLASFEGTATLAQNGGQVDAMSVRASQEPRRATMASTPKPLKSGTTMAPR